MANEKIKNSLLALMLSDHAMPASFRLERVDLREGPFVTSGAASKPCLYFPIDALLTLGSAQGADHGLSLIGCHACLDSQPVFGSALQAFVRVPGQAYQMDWPLAQDNAAFYADCLWHAASATHGLIRQMAQWSFCVQHHTRAQSLCSWLLHCLAQQPDNSFGIHLAHIPPFLRSEIESSQNSSEETKALSGYVLAQGRLHISSPPRLAQQACSCHQTLAMAPIVNA